MPSSGHPSSSISPRRSYSYSGFSPDSDSSSPFPFCRLLLVAVMLIPFPEARSTLRGAAAAAAAAAGAEDVPGFGRDVDGDDVTVRTGSGEIRGKRRIGDVRSGGVTTTVDWFLGIPYAKPPVGDRRFQRPESLDPWTPRIREAFRFGPPCPQVASSGMWNVAPSFQSEDCLYLNVYSPYENNSREAVYPVMVYVHGGSYRVGSGNIFASHLLAQYGVVVVTINYRLGILGFLTANRPELEGNYGLLDQILALEWIKSNIRAFRGNPEKVTVFGNSAGGAAVGLLCVTPLAKGLFTRAIVQSGSPLAFWAVHNETAELSKYVRALASELSCSRQNLAELVTCLRTVDWRAFVWDENDDNALEDRLPHITQMGIDLIPVIDGDVIPKSPEQLMREGAIVPKAVMTGIVEDEWLWLSRYFLEDLPDQESCRYENAVHEDASRSISNITASRDLPALWLRRNYLRLGLPRVHQLE